MQNSNPSRNPFDIDRAHLRFRLKSPWLPWTRARWVAIYLVTIAYAAVFVTLEPYAHEVTGALALIPATIVGALLGAPLGVVMGLVYIGLNFLLFSLYGVPPSQFLSNPVNYPSVVILVVGGASGWASEVLARYRIAAEFANKQSKELTRQNEYYQALHETTLGLIGHMDVKELLQTVLLRAGGLVGTSHGYVFWREPGEADFQMRVGVGVYASFVGSHAQPGVGLAGLAIQKGEPVVVDDYPSWGQRLRDPSRDVLQAVIGIPIKSSGQVMGVIGLAYLEKGRKFAAPEIDILNRFAQLASVALDNSLSYANAQMELAERKRVEEELRGTQKFLDSVIDNLPIMLFAKEAKELRFVRWNKFGEELVGFSRNEMLGKNDYDLFPDSADFYIAKDREVLKGKKMVDIPEETVQSRDKGVRYLHTRKVPILDENGEPQYLLGISEDITDQRHIEEATRRQNAYLTALHETSLALMQRLDTQELLRSIVSRAASLVGTEHGYVYLQDAESDQVEMRIGVGVYEQMVGQRLYPGVGLAGKVWESGQSLVVDDYRTWPLRLQSSNREVLRAVAGVPLTSGDKTVGVIGLAFLDEESKFGQTEMDMLNRFAELASLALNNARLLEQVQGSLETTRRAAEREATIAQVKDRLHAGTEVEGILRTAVEELRRTTGRPRAVIRLNRERGVN